MVTFWLISISEKRTNQKNYVFSSELVNVGSPNLLLNGHILTIYLEFVPIMGMGWDGLLNVNAKMKMFMFFHALRFLTVATIVG